MIQSEDRGSKRLYKASAVAQKMQVFPKNASQTVKIDVTPLFETKAENYSSLNKLLRICLRKSFNKKFGENQHTSRSAQSKRN